MEHKSKVSREQVTGLLKEIRSWANEDEFASIYELAQRHNLAPFVIERIAASEGIHLLRGNGEEGIPYFLGSDATTRPLNKVSEVDEDAETAKYRKNPTTGKFERVS